MTANSAKQEAKACSDDKSFSSFQKHAPLRLFLHSLDTYHQLQAQGSHQGDLLHLLAARENLKQCRFWLLGSLHSRMQFGPPLPRSIIQHSPSPLSATCQHYPYMCVFPHKIPTSSYAHMNGKCLCTSEHKGRLSCHSSTHFSFSVCVIRFNEAACT